MVFDDQQCTFEGTFESSLLISYFRIILLSSVTKQLWIPFLDLQTLKMPSTRKF